jgi:hypothetical protein
LIVIVCMKQAQNWLGYTEVFRRSTFEQKIAQELEKMNSAILESDISSEKLSKHLYIQYFTRLMPLLVTNISCNLFAKIAKPFLMFLSATSIDAVMFGPMATSAAAALYVSGPCLVMLRYP